MSPESRGQALHDGVAWVSAPGSYSCVLNMLCIKYADLCIKYASPRALLDAQGGLFQSLKELACLIDERRSKK